MAPGFQIEDIRIPRKSLSLFGGENWHQTHKNVPCLLPRSLRLGQKRRKSTSWTCYKQLGQETGGPYLRRSASQTHSDGSLIERLGGEDEAFRSFHAFYEAKYARPAGEPDISEDQEQALLDRHQQEEPLPITPQEVAEALAKTKPSTASGLDSVCYTAIKAYHQADEEGKLATFFTNILRGVLPVPKDWLVGKICFLPKVPRPSKVKDLRPISLTPCLGKLYSKILVSRLRSTLPGYRAGQHACRPGTQALEAITAAQAALKIHRQATGKQLLVAKLDISQALDTLSHHAIWRYLVDALPSREALALWQLCRNTSIHLQVGSRSWTQFFVSWCSSRNILQC